MIKVIMVPAGMGMSALAGAMSLEMWQEAQAREMEKRRESMDQEEEALRRAMEEAKVEAKEVRRV